MRATYAGGFANQWGAPECIGDRFPSGRHFDVKSLIGDFSDPRMERTRRHELFELVFVALCATIAGSDGWADIERIGVRRLERLRTFQRLENGIPSHDAVGGTAVTLPRR
ncbi:transposase family protein [Schlesneria paludicola]|uniref:transposase family protein n=1 Tax=Schlesneria paludicola TaxID=360056 RepID=UPI000681A120